MKRILVVFAAALLLPAGLVIVHRVACATQYGAGYSEAAFEQIKEGLPEEKVRIALGNPLGFSRRSNDTGTNACLYYAESGGLLPWYNIRDVYVFNGVVVGKDKRFGRRHRNDFRERLTGSQSSSAH